jgi:hypothetical protein
MGFYDQHDRLIVTASNLTDQGLSGSVRVRGLPAGNYTATDLVMGAVLHFTVAEGRGMMQFPITRWDTRAFVIRRA